MGYRPENTLPGITTLIRSIDLPACEDYNADQQWFINEELMHQYLAGNRGAYADKNGTVVNVNGTIIGLWYYTKLGSVHPDPKVGWGKALNREVLEDAEPTDSLGRAIDAAMKAMGHNRMVAKVRERFINSGNTPMSDMIAEDQDDWKHAPYGQTDHDLDEARADDMADYQAMRGNTPQMSDAEFHAQMVRECDEAHEELPCVGSYEGCQCEECSSLTEEELMGQAGMSDEEIAGVFHVDKLSSDLAEARDTVATLLGRIDDYLGEGMHLDGRTPCWYVEAAAISMGITLDNGGKDPVDTGDFGAGTRGNPNWEQRKSVPGRFQRKPVELTGDELDECPF